MQKTIKKRFSQVNELPRFGKTMENVRAEIASF